MAGESSEDSGYDIPRQHRHGSHEEKSEHIYRSTVPLGRRPGKRLPCMDRCCLARRVGGGPGRIRPGRGDAGLGTANDETGWVQSACCEGSGL
jgi:hypothetical protein